MNSAKLRLLVCSSMLVLASQSSFAETSSSAGQAADLDIIVVTAQRQKQNLQQTPLSVAAFTGKLLKERGISSVENLASQTPGLAVKTDFGSANPNIYIRGVGIGDFNANYTGAVGVYIDEVYISAPSGQLFQFYDVDRVEVLRGPQGTLYGRNTTGGAINIFSRKPTNEIEANASATYGRFNETQLEAGVGGPLVEGKLKARIAGTMRKRDGTIRNTYTGPKLAPDHVADMDSWAARGIVEFTPAESTSFLLNAHYGTSNSTGVRYKHRGLLNPTAFAGGQIVPCDATLLATGTCVDALGYSEGNLDPNTVQYNKPVIEEVTAWGVNLNSKFEINDYSLTSITAYENVKRYNQIDVDESPLDLLNAVHNPESHQFSEEIRLASPVNDRFHWVAGGFYFNEKIDFKGTLDIFRQVRPAIAAAATTLNLGPPLSLGFNPLGGPALAALLGNPIFAYPTIAPVYNYNQKTDSWALFGQAYYDITDALTATVGMRYSKEDRTFDYMSALVEPFITIPLAETSAALGNNKTGFKDLSWRFALEWQASEDIFTYAAVSKGSKSGGFNGAFLLYQNLTAPFNDENLISYEAGFKSEWLDHRLRFNATTFYYDYSDLQIYTLQNNGGIPQQLLSNAPGARVYGAEFELLTRPVENLTISAGVSLLNTKINKSFIGPSGTDMKGNELAYAPKFTASGSAAYAIPLGDSGRVILSGDWSYHDASYTDTNNHPFLRTDSALVLGTSVAYRTADSRWELSAWGRNITNKRYITYIANLADFGFQRVQYSDPATYGLTIKFDY